VRPFHTLVTAIGRQYTLKIVTLVVSTFLLTAAIAVGLAYYVWISPPAEATERGIAAITALVVVVYLHLGIVTIALAGNVSLSVKRLGARADEVRDGDLQTPVSTRRTDEIGDLYEKFDAMRLQLQAQIKQSALIENASDLITVLDKNGTIIYQSPSSASIIGYSPEEMVDTKFLSFIHPDDQEAVESTLESITDKHRDAKRFEVRLEDAEGSVRTFEGICENLLETPFVEGIIVSSRDISKRKRRERQLHQANERLDNFASFVSHDLRNPLGIANMYLGFAQDTGDSEDFEAVQEALDRMDEMITGFLKLSKIDDQNLEIKPLSLSAIATTAWSHVQTDQATLDIDDQTICADREFLSHVFENLFRNAVEHGRSDVQVTVGLLESKDGFYVEDDGPGIPESRRDEIFTQGVSSNDNGSGYGLSIVETVILAHDWEINVTEGTDGGARFEITGTDSGRVIEATGTQYTT